MNNFTTALDRSIKHLITLETSLTIASLVFEQLKLPLFLGVGYPSGISAIDQAFGREHSICWIVSALCFFANSGQILYCTLAALTRWVHISSRAHNHEVRRSRFTSTRRSIEPRQLLLCDCLIKSSCSLFLSIHLSHSITSYCCFLYGLPLLEASSYLFDFLLKYSLRNPPKFVSD